MKGILPRATVVVAGFTALGVAAAFLLRGGPGSLPYSCTFHEVTGLHCAGCGMTRAVHAAMEGRFAEALRFNPLGVVLLPLLAIALIPEVFGWVRGRPPAWRFPTGAWVGVLLVAGVFGYTILRNLPWLPFTLLAPPG